MRIVAITGTDTGVGKTVVTACLAEASRRAGRRVVALKPVASGVPRGSFGGDAELLASAAGHSPLIHTRLSAPVSPHRAARHVGTRIDIEAITAWIAGFDADDLLVEGVGGWRVPLQEDPVREFRHLLPPAAGVLVVSADRLGTINHTRLTVDAVRADGWRPVGIAMNRGVGPEDVSRATNAADLASLIGLPLAIVARIDPADGEARAAVGRALWSTVYADPP